VTGGMVLAYVMFFLGRNCVFGLLCTLKSKKAQKAV